MLQNMFACHVALCANVVVMAADTLPPHPRDGIQATPITHLPRVDSSWKNLQVELRRIETKTQGKGSVSTIYV